MQANQTIDNINFFGQLLAVLSDEEVIRVRRRFEMADNRVMVEVMTDEIEEREGIALSEALNQYGNQVLSGTSE